MATHRDISLCMKSNGDISNYRLLDRYILLKYLKTFILALALIIIIVITFDISEKLDDFLGNNAPFKAIVFDYYLNFIPNFINLYSPLFIFISVLFFTSKMAGNTEIIAILGSGISYRRMLRPYLHGSIIIAILVLIIGNFVIPRCNATLNEFESKYIKTVPRSHTNNSHFQSKKGTQVYVESYDLKKNVGYKFYRDVFRPNGELVERITCDRIEYDTISKKWNCHGLFRRTIIDGKEKLTYSVYKVVDFGITPTDFDFSAKQISTMNSIQLIRYIQDERIRGTGIIKSALIELYQRLLNPLAIIVMTFIGVAISSRKTRGGIGVHLAIGISIAFAFVVFMKVSTVFATNGNLTAFLSVLLPQLVFGVAAFFLIRSAPK